MDAFHPLSATRDITSLQLMASADAGTRDAASVTRVGEEFESVFLSMLLKNMRSTVSGEGLFAGDSSDTYGSMFDLFMSQQLASTNALGIGQMIESFLNNNSHNM